MSTKSIRPSGFYWVQYGTEWQVARYGISGWFLPGMCEPIPEDQIDKIGQPVVSNQFTERFRRSGRTILVLLIFALLWLAISLIDYFLHIHNR